MAEINDNLRIASKADLKALTAADVHALPDITKQIDIGARPNANILHNWYFPNPVNRKGQTEYTSTTDWVSTIDRFRVLYSTLIVGDGYCKCVTDKSAKYKRFVQQILGGTLHAGQKYTLSMLAKVNDIGGTTWLRCCNSELGLILNGGYFLINTVTNDYALYRLTFAPSVDVPDYYFDLLTFNTESDYIDIDIKAVKLELGDQQTLAHQDANGKWVLNEIPDYAEQMAICQQYNTSTDAYIGGSVPLDGSVAMSGNLGITNATWKKENPDAHALVEQVGTGHTGLYNMTKDSTYVGYRLRAITDETTDITDVAELRVRNSAIGNKQYTIFGEHNKELLSGEEYSLPVASGFGNSNAYYRKDAAGYVHLRGNVTGVTTLSTIFATLPVGYRPYEDGKSTSFRALTTQSGGGGNASFACRLEIWTGGNIVISDSIDLNKLKNWVSLDGISFYAGV